jgi:hypothetical protein
MSLLGTPVYSSPGNSYWAPTNQNATFNRDVTVDGALEVKGNVFMDGELIFNNNGGEITIPVSGNPTGQNCYSMVKDDTGNLRWSIGTIAAEPGANQGNDFQLCSYNDDGTLRATCIGIVRLDNSIVTQGNVTVGGDVTADNSLVTTSATVGSNILVGGGNLSIDGAAGQSRVYDPEYNPPNAGVDSLMLSQGGDGTIVSNTPFTPTKSGTYILSLTIQAQGTSWSWNTGTNSLNYALTYNSGTNVVSGAQFYVAGLVNPTGMPARGPLNADSFEYQSDILVQLDAGETYTIAYGATGGAYNLGIGGNVGIIVAKLIE